LVDLIIELWFNALSALEAVMTPTQVINFFGGKANTARKCGISYQAVDKWTEKGEVPEGRQALIQIQTDGALMAEKSPEPNQAA
jgi:hypothetical protein